MSSVATRVSGVVGATVSIITVIGVDFGDSFPASSVIVVDKLCSPSSNGFVVISTSPSVIFSGVSSVVPTGVSPSYIVTISPTFTSSGNVTIDLGVVSFVSWPSIGFPLSSFTTIVVGVVGATVSTITVVGVELGDSLPASSVIVVDKSCSPSSNGFPGVTSTSPSSISSWVIGCVPTGVSPS